MPEHEAISCPLGDGFLLIAAGIRRERNGDLSVDLMLKNGQILHADRAILNSAEGRGRWAGAAVVPNGPTADRMAQALQDYVLPDALAVLQEDSRKPTQADQLVGLVVRELDDLATDVAAAVDLFHDPAGIAFATMPIGEHRETWPLRSRGFREWLARRYHQQAGKTPNAQALVDAANVLAGMARFDGPDHPVHLRLAAQDGVIWLDLANDRWEAIAIDQQGWRLVADSPVKFRRTRGMLPLPIPQPGGNLNLLRSFLNLPIDDPTLWILVVAWLVGALRPHGPYPVLVVHGEQGSAKSTLTRVLRQLIDPNQAPIRTLPRDERDLMLAATNGWCLAFDNLSRLPEWQSDALCRISTGGGFAARELYSDLDETILDVQRPVILNGIEELAARNDLLDRSLIVYLPAIPPERRRSERAFWSAFEQARPAILGALLDAVVMALRREAMVQLPARPRMADFAEWIVAAEPALPWPAGAFLAAHAGNQTDANELSLDASPVAAVVRTFINRQSAPWTGTASDLLRALDGSAEESVRKQKTWPMDGRTLANALRRLAPNLRAVGVDVGFARTGRKRLITLERPGSPASSPSPASSSAVQQQADRPTCDASDDADDAASRNHPAPGAAGDDRWTRG